CGACRGHHPARLSGILPQSPVHRGPHRLCRGPDPRPSGRRERSREAMGERRGGIDMKIGILSDTHGLLRPEVFTHFEGVDHILHAGDLGPLDLLVELEAIAPVTVVWGNTDAMDVRATLPEMARVRLGDVEAAGMHGHQFGSLTPPLRPDERR